MRLLRPGLGISSELSRDRPLLWEFRQSLVGSFGMKLMVREYHLHMISDSTGETLNVFAKAVSAQFDGAAAREHIYSLVRSENQLRRALQHITANPGIVFSTLVNPALRHVLEQECAKLNFPCVNI